jgi:hypothetical protein
MRMQADRAPRLSCPPPCVARRGAVFEPSARSRAFVVATSASDTSQPTNLRPSCLDATAVVPEPRDAGHEVAREGEPLDPCLDRGEGLLPLVLDAIRLDLRALALHAEHHVVELHRSEVLGLGVGQHVEQDGLP